MFLVPLIIIAPECGAIKIIKTINTISRELVNILSLSYRSCKNFIVCNLHERNNSQSIQQTTLLHKHSIQHVCICTRIAVNKLKG